MSPEDFGLAARPRAGGRRSWSWAPTRSPPSSPSRSRAPAASSSRRTPTGPRSSASATQHDILLIADEVICGFGRTGNWFGSQTLGIKPDIMTIAKGLTSGYLPLGGVDRSATAWPR